MKTFQIGRGPAGLVFEHVAHRTEADRLRGRVRRQQHLGRRPRSDQRDPVPRDPAHRFSEHGAAMTANSRFASGSSASLAAAAACSPTPNILPTNDFNRPTDLAFMCLGRVRHRRAGRRGGDRRGIVHASCHVSGRPMRACHPPGPPTLTTRSRGVRERTNRTFAFLPNSASGELSVIDADHWHIVDLDPSSGGYGRLPLGSVPEQISVSDDGCRLVSANRGSCDLTLVDPSALLAPAFDAAYGGIAKPLPAPSTSRQLVVPHGADGVALGVAPFEVNFLPQDTTESRWRRQPLWLRRREGADDRVLASPHRPRPGVRSSPSRPATWSRSSTFPGVTSSTRGRSLTPSGMRPLWARTRGPRRPVRSRTASGSPIPPRAVSRRPRTPVRTP